MNTASDDRTSRWLMARATWASPVPSLDELSVCTENGVLRVRATKRVSIDDPYMVAHFPGRTIFPGVFTIECARHAFRVAIFESLGVSCDLRSVRSVRFLAPLIEGDVLTIQGTTSGGGPHLEADADGWRSDGVRAAKLRLTFRVSTP